MFISIVLFIIGLVLLIFCGDWFVDGATGIARKFHIPELIIGATVVSIGTTLPEVMVSADAAIKGQGATAYGNAIGSIICNTALILAITFGLFIVRLKSLRTKILLDADIIKLSVLSFIAISSSLNFIFLVTLYISLNNSSIPSRK